ncbi:MAG TPA: thrombospondin type 3 repeat-containing protein [Fibrobacteria bacterium]|nr:thrombospondin type 3 repeat-containing protein [Fibrobacteria bacterium]HOX51359.1 thrombospondin type 3 repeat-containing protein [Fibrobacteria bacterium]
MNPIRTLLLAIPSAAPLAIALHPRPLEGEFGVGAGIGVQRYSGSMGDEGSAYGRIQTQYHPTEWLGTRLVFGFGNVGNGDAKPTFLTKDFCHLGVDLLLQPSLDWGAVRPFAFAGVASTFGTAQFSNRSPQDLDGNVFVPVGAGAEVLLTERLSVWAHMETYLVMADGDRIDGISSKGGYFERRDELQKLVVGASWTFGSFSLPHRSATVEAPAAALPGDRDGDGIKDEADRCPGTPANMLVDVQGCPSDADRDGIPDLLDDCPSTPIGNRVDEFGCTVGNDKDHDGIPDAVDRCPASPRNMAVDAAGCPVAAIAKPAADSDKDGVPDSRDLCSASPSGTKVDTDGCAPTPPSPVPTEPPSPATNSDSTPIAEPAPVGSTPPEAVSAVANRPQPPVEPTKIPPTKPAKPEKDSDRDGVPDSRDRCRSTARGSTVDSSGCSAPADPEADSDKDGVRDIGDLCPNSKYGMKVDATGCQILTFTKGSQAILEGVQFQQGTARLLETSLPVLEHLARVLKRNPAKVEIAGFTERRGPEGENLSLSLRRAEAVKEHLVNLGTEPGRISVRGYGSAEPIADNAVEAGRLRNRRIEVRVR